MEKSIHLILNDRTIKTNVSKSTSLLDFLREDIGFKGTKVGCREGDCGACTVLVGQLDQNEIKYQSIISCLTPLGNVNGKHVVSIEGINLENSLNTIQTHIANEGGTQCGFCTPGFVVSMTGYFLNNSNYHFDDGINAIAGNICRCTGYKSLERSIKRVINDLNNTPGKNNLQKLIKAQILPPYFESIQDRLIELHENIEPSEINQSSNLIVGGGTDLYLQQPDKVYQSDLFLIKNQIDLNYIELENNIIEIGSATTLSQILGSEIIKNSVQNSDKLEKLFGSILIRNVATIGGNIVNASPIADFTMMLLALQASIVLKNGDQTREIELKQFYLGYKKLDLKDEEIIKSIKFRRPDSNSYFNFEKVSKRTHLDIASVNSAISIELDDHKVITSIGLSAGGVAPIPLFLENTSEFLRGKVLTPKLVNKAVKVAMDEISPISDIRGSAEYKQLLLRQLIYSHFVELYPDVIKLKELIV